MLLRHSTPSPSAPTGLTAYIAWADRQIGRVIVAEHLHAALLRVIEGPTTITFRLRLTRDATKANLSRLLSLDGALAHALQVAAADVRLSATAEGILLQVPHPAPWTPTAAQLVSAYLRSAHLSPSAQPSTVIGLDASRQPVLWNLAASPHLLAVGPTQRGKTEAVKSILAGLSLESRPGEFAFVVLAKKTVSWQAMSQTAACVALITDPTEQERYVRWLATRLDERTANNQAAPILITVLDDAHDIAATADVLGPLQRLAGLGAAVGLYLFATTQTTGKRGGVGDLEHNFATRLVFGATDAAAAARFAGAGGTGADRVGRTKGDALFIRDGESQRVATARCEDAWLLTALPSRDKAAWPQPWRTTPHHPAPVRTGAAPISPTYPDLPPREAQQGDGDASTSANTSAAPVPAPLAPPSSPALLPSDRLPTSDEIERIVAVRQRTGSLNQTCIEVYGPKNTRRAALVKFACGDPLTIVDQAELARLTPKLTVIPASPPPPVSASTPLPNLDLDSEADRQILAALLRDGAIRVTGRPVR